MKYLSAEYIRKAIAGDERFDQNVEFDEPGKAMVWLADGWTWYRLDDNRTVEGFVIAARNSDEAPRDTVAYWKEQVAKIQTILEPSA